SQRCTVRISRRKYAAISPHDSSLRSLPGPPAMDSGIGWTIRVQTCTGVYSAIARGETGVSLSEGSKQSLGRAVAPQCQSDQHGDHRETGEKKSERAGLWR